MDSNMTNASRKCDFCRERKRKCEREGEWDPTTGTPKCQACFHSNLACGPDLTQRESGFTQRGTKRRRTGDPVSTSPEILQSHSLFQPAVAQNPQFHQIQSHNNQAHTSQVQYESQQPASPILLQKPEAIESAQYIETSVLPIVDEKLEEIYEMKKHYEYLNHRPSTTALLERDQRISPASNSRDTASLRLEVTTEIKCEEILELVEQDTKSAELNILKVYVALQRFRYLAGDNETILRPLHRAICALISLLQERYEAFSKGKGKVPEGSALGNSPFSFRIKALEKERNAISARFEHRSRSISPPTPDVPGGPSNMEPIPYGGLYFQPDLAKQERRAETKNSKHILDLAPAKKAKYPNRKIMSSPPCHQAFLCGTDEEALGWVKSAEASTYVDFFGRSVIHVAAKQNRVHFFEPEDLEKYKEYLDDRDEFGLTPIMTCAIHGSLESMMRLADAGVSLSERDRTGRNLVALAAKHGHQSVVEYLINKQGLDPNDREGNGLLFPLHDAIESGKIETSIFLILAGADLEAAINGKTAEQLAIEKSPDCLGPLIKRLKFLSDNTIQQSPQRKIFADIGRPPSSFGLESVPHSSAAVNTGPASSSRPRSQTAQPSVQQLQDFLLDPSYPEMWSNEQQGQDTDPNFADSSWPEDFSTK